MNIALVGYGKMGRAIAQLAGERGHAVVAVVGAAENQNGAGLTAEGMAAADVVFEFTGPDVAVTNLLGLARLGKRVVTGTTGWLGRLPEVSAMVKAHGGALLHSPNFSPGVQLFLRAAADLARRFGGQPGFDAFVVESHHGAKKDAPSGTAAALRRALQ